MIENRSARLRCGNSPEVQHPRRREGTRLKELAGLPPALLRMFIKKRGGVGQRAYPRDLRAGILQASDHWRPTGASPTHIPPSRASSPPPAAGQIYLQPSHFPAVSFCWASAAGAAAAGGAAGATRGPSSSNLRTAGPCVALPMAGPEAHLGPPDIHNCSAMI